MKLCNSKVARILALGTCVAALAASSSVLAQVAEPVRDPAAPGTSTQTSEQAEESLDASPPVNSEGPETEDKSQIVVTGTLVRGIAPPGTNVIATTQADVQATGATTTAQLLQTIPQLGSFNDLQQPIAGGTSVTVNRPNLRNLPNFNTSGGSTTLVLMDGHRIVGAGIVTTTPDPDIIPPFAIDRLEIVPDGGSAIYGSDAVAGVLNFITRKRFDGLELSGHYGFADNYHQADINGIAGKDWGSGSAYVTYTYAEHGAIYGRDRDYIQEFPNQSTSAPDFGLLSVTCDPGNVQLTATSTTFFPLPFTTATARAGTPNQCDLNDNSTFYPREHRHSVFGGLSQDFSDIINLDIRAFYTNRETTVNGGPFAQTTTNVPVARFPTQRIGTETTQVVSYQFGGIAAGRQDVTLETWGLTPTLTAQLGGGWRARLLGGYGRSDTESHQASFNQQALAASITAGLFNPYNPVASDPTALAVILNNEGFARTRQRMANARLVVDGDLFQLPGGSVKVAAGGEYYRENYGVRQGSDVIPGAALSGAPSVSLGSVLLRSARDPLRSVQLKRNVKSAFGEVVVPIFGADNATTMLQELTLSVAGRYDDYSDVGSTFNPKYGLTWRPIDWVKLRGSYGELFNAPSLADDVRAIDKSVFYVGFGALLPVASLRVSGGGPYPDPLPGQLSVLAFRGNSPNIRPQSAKTLSLGMDVQPPFVEGLNLSLTYFRIKLKNVIGIPPGDNFTRIYTEFASAVDTTVTAEDIAAVLAGAGSVANIAAGNCTPQPQCVYAIVNVAKQNLGNFNLEGLDFNGAYHVDTGFGGLNFGLNANYELKREQNSNPGQPFIDNLAANNGRFKLRASAGAEIGNLLAQVVLNHNDGYKLVPPIGFVPLDRVSSYDVVNLFFKYDVPGEGLFEDLELTMNVDNVFDSDPPEFRGPQSGGRGRGIINGSTLGRLVQFGVRKKF